jgi:hypothetical protein
MEMPVLVEDSTVGERRRQGGVGMKVRDPRVSMLSLAERDDPL